jgi:hypothetical protein
MWAFIFWPHFACNDFSGLLRPLIKEYVMQIIKLTLHSGVPVHVVASKVEFFVPGATSGTVISLPSHNNGGLAVKESVAVVLQLLENANG